MARSSCMQDVICCDVCELPNSTMQCDICQIYLCRTCVEKHLSGESKEHRVVTIKRRVHYPTCSKHNQQLCDFYCEQCDIPFCSECVSSGEHEGHKQLGILKVNLLKDLKELENLISPEYRELLSKIPILKVNISENSERVTSNIQEYGEYLHREIETAIQKLICDVKETKSTLIADLNAQEHEICCTESEISKHTEKLKKILKSNDVSLVSAYKSRNAEFRRIPKLSLFRQCFTPGKTDIKNIVQCFLSIEEEQQGYTMDAPGAVFSSKVKSFIDKPRIITIINTWYEDSILCSVSCLNDENIWTCGKDSIMRLYNLDGILVKEIETKSGNRPLDIAVTSRGDLIYSDFQEGSVNIVNNTVVKSMIKFQGWRPCYICSTSYDDLLIVNISDDEKETRIVRYAGSKQKQIIQFDEKGQPLFSSKAYPKYISENKNQDICMSDYYAGAVVVVNKAGKFRFKYYGFPNKKSFTPYGITTDSKSQILTADYANHSIHILDQGGQFLRCFDNLLIHPRGICVDTRDNLFVAELFSGKVKKIQYYD